MSKPEEIRFEFSNTGGEMLEKAIEVKDYVVEDLSVITPYDEEIDEEYVTGYTEAINKAQQMPIDDAVIDQQAGKSAIVIEKRKLSEDHFQDVKYFVEKAFPKNKAVKKEFGYNDYERVKQKPAQFVLFLKQLGLTVNKYDKQLKAKGMPDAMLTRSAALAAELETASKEHEQSKKGRTLSTQDRRIAYNEVWGMLKQICLAGKMVFRTNYARYRRYILYDGNQTPPPVGEEYESLPPLQSATALNEFSTTSILLFKNVGVTELRFFRHTIEEEPNGTVGFILTSKAEVVKPVSEVPGTGDFINVTNLSETESGLFLVQMAE